MPQASIIIPALNEAESIGHVVDNGSTDGTAEIAPAAGARVIQSQRGYGAACLAGSNAALATSDILVYMDGDGSDGAAEQSAVGLACTASGNSLHAASLNHCPRAE